MVGVAIDAVHTYGYREALGARLASLQAFEEEEERLDTRLGARRELMDNGCVSVRII